MRHTPDLIASYWTLAGDIAPFVGSSVSPRRFRDRVEAAARAGFTGFGSYYDDLMFNVDELGLEEMAAILRGNGIKYFEIESLLDWFTDGERRSRSDAVRKDMLRAAEKLGAHQIKIAGAFEDGWPLASLIEPYARLCDQAADVGTRISLEILPFSNIRTIAEGLAVVGDTAIENGGLLFDVWHMVRGAIPFEEIAHVPPQFIAAVELDDGPLEPVGSLLQETIDCRELCGEGDFDLPGFVASIQATGYQGPYGVEILSHEHRARSLEDSARLAFESAMRQFPET